MNDRADKIRENRLRRMAVRQGLQVKKSRRRDPRAIDFGTYYLFDPKWNAIAAGPDMSLDELERALTE